MGGRQPETYSISWWAVDFGQDPACLQRVWADVATDTRQAADQLAAERQLDAVADAELRGGPRGSYAPCPPAPGAPAIDATAAQAFADRAAELLPVADPSISGSYAITGLRSWVDLGRPSTFEAEERLDLGPFARTATMRATATTTVDWGDGTLTEHTTPGGGYREGEPGPADIVHTYIDAAPSMTLVVTDTWDITVSVPGLDDITLTWTAPGEGITFPVREVRSARDR